MNIIIRNTNEKDYKITVNLTREAFWDVYKPGCDEHLVLHKMRKVPAFVNELDFIALTDEKVIGNIVYTIAKVVNDKEEFTVLCMGPLAVLPEYQNKGVGGMLLKHSIEKAKEMGFKAVIIYGNPDYYHRFGFVDSKNYNIQTSTGENFDAFMTLELYNGALKGVYGKFYEDNVFQTDKEETELFEKEFPYKEKHVTDTQIFK